MKQFIKRFIALSIMVMMVAVSIMGCSKSEVETNSQGSETTAAKTEDAATTDKKAEVATQEIVFWNLGVEEPDKTILDSAVVQYNAAQTSFKVTAVPTQNDAYKEKLVIAMSSGKCPDAYTSWSGGPMNEYIEAGFAQPIDDLMNASGVKDKIMEAALAQGSYNGKLYSVPMLNVTISGVFYNKEMFSKYNLEIPTTVSELEKVCDTLIANGITPFALANASKWTGSMYFMNLATRHGGLKPFQDAVAGTGSFENESFVYAGQKIQEWVKKGYFPEGVNSLSEDDGQAKQLLYQETAAMSLIGSWYTGAIKADSEDFYQKVGWFSFPAVDGSTADSTIQIGTIGDQFISFNCTGEKLAAAFSMVENYFSDENVQLMVDSGKIPPVKNVAELITDPVSKSILEAANKASSVQLWYDQYLPPAVGEVHKDTCQEIFGLTLTPEEANAKLQAAMQEYISSKK
ncbi:MAG: extracellular solute-binding protein [Vallitaleaceae bacterium]|nr:extracellular solute-binding protein [Vallitaleaceae bacterium]